MSSNKEDSTIVILNAAYSKLHPAITFQINWVILLVFLALIIVLYLSRKYLKRKVSNLFADEISFEINLGFIKIDQKVKRDFQNLYIANRIYIELVTRKAALEIDPEFDVIKEVYDSWYKMFDIIRSEIKNIPGEYLVNNSAKELINLTIQILNEGMRPHLTTYQAKFRSWYELKLKEQEGDAPQKIQKGYPDYDELIESMLGVNQLLIIFSNKLENFISGNQESITNNKKQASPETDTSGN